VQIRVRRRSAGNQKGSRHMARKYKQKKIKGVRVTEKIEGKKDRPLFPRAAVFKSRKAYDRKREKERTRREIEG
jgi:hypothetical protein